MTPLDREAAYLWFGAGFLVFSVLTPVFSVVAWAYGYPNNAASSTEGFALGAVIFFALWAAEMFIDEGGGAEPDDG